MLGLVDKMHRRQASRRGREVSRAKAEKGHVTGGRLCWGASSIRAVIFEPLYRAEIVYGRTRWAHKGGTKVTVAVPEAEWIRVPAPHLPVVTEAHWRAAHQRLDRTRQTHLRHTSGKLWGRPESGIESKWLLAGFLACAACGGGMSATWSYDARRTRQSYYRCNTRRARGTWLCANNHTVSVAAPASTC